MICRDGRERNLVRHADRIEEEKISPCQQAETPQKRKVGDDIGGNEQAR